MEYAPFFCPGFAPGLFYALPVVLIMAGNVLGNTFS